MAEEEAGPHVMQHTSGEHYHHHHHHPSPHQYHYDGSGHQHPQHGSTSSDDWREKGAATMVRNEADENGVMTSRVIKKGVKDFSFGRVLGEGSYSTVVMASDRQSLRDYAIKVLDKRHIIKEKKVKYVNIEKNTLNRLGDHPGIIRLYYTFQDERSLYFVLDFAPNGELLSLIKRMGSLDEECTRYYGAQLLDAVEYMHSKGVIHRDLKPENVLLDDKMRIRITDFGTAKLLDEIPSDSNTTNDEQEEEPRYPDDVRARSFVGTAEYVSPELLTDKAVGRGCDIWAFGCIMYQLIAGRPPFKASNEYQTFQKIVKLQYSYPPGFPSQVRDVVKRVLVLNPKDRASIDHIKSLGFFQNQQWDRRSVWKRPPPRLQPFKPSTSGMTAVTPGHGGLVGGPRNATAKLLRQPHHYFPSANQYNNKNAPPVQQPQGNSPPGGGAGVSASAAAMALKQQHQQNQQILKQQQQQQQQQPQQSQQLSPYGIPPSTNGGRPQLTGRRKSSQTQQQQQQPQESQPQAKANEQSVGSTERGMQNLKLDTSDATVRSPPQLEKRPSQPIMNQSNRSPQLEKRSSQILLSQQEAKSPQLDRRPSQPIQIPEAGPLDAKWASFLKSYNERVLKVAPVTIVVHASRTGGADSDDSDTNTREPSKFTKFFGGARRKKRTLLVTSHARMLILDEKPRCRVEFPLSIPQILIREYAHNRKTNTGSFSIETRTKIYTIEDPKGSSEWMQAVDKSRAIYSQVTAQSQQNAATTATAAALAATGATTSPTAAYNADSSLLLQKNEERKRSRGR
jgi:serine/threonine protein kinase